jgi:AMIN domain-containing protein
VSPTTFILVCGALALAFGATADEQGRLIGVRIGGDDRTSGVVIESDRPLSFTTLKLLSPPRVVVDFADTEVAVEQRELEIGDGTLRRAAVAQAGSRTARVVIELVADAEFDIRSDGNAVEVRVPRPVALAAGPAPQPGPATPAGPQTGPAPQAGPALEAGPEAEAQKVASLPKVSLVGSKPAVPPDPEDPVDEPQPSAAEKAAALKKAPSEQRALADQKRHKPAQATARVAPPAGERPLQKPPPAQARHITGIGFRPIGAGEVIVRSDHPLEYGISGDGSAVLLHLPSAAIPLPNNRRPLDTRFFEGAVSRVVPVQVADGTDVRIELRGHAEYQLAQSGSVLTVTFSAPR